MVLSQSYECAIMFNSTSVSPGKFYLDNFYYTTCTEAGGFWQLGRKMAPRKPQDGAGSSHLAGQPDIFRIINKFQG